MTVQELIKELEYMNLEAEVRLATQPSYPLEYTLANVVEVDLSKDPWDDPDPIMDGSGEGVVYLGVGGQIGYLPKQAANELGW